MDTTKTITHIGLCAGYGGIELGLGRVIPTLRSVALCEIEAFAISNLVAKMEAGLMDPAPVWTDLKTFSWESFRDRVDILTGGYPCQPFSAAGKRAGKDDPRHLWPWIADGIRILRPRMCFFENVEGHISLGLSSVISDLEELGYKVSWGIFSAREVGAPHQRKRVFILAYRIGDGYDWRELQDRMEGWSSGQLPQPHSGESCGVRSKVSGCGQVWPSRPGEAQHAWEPPRVVANPESKRTRCRSELCGEECGQGRTLPREFEQPDQAMGNATEREDHGRESRDLGQAAGEGRCGNDAADSAGEAMGNAESEQGASRDHREESGAISNTQQVESGGGDCGSLRDCNRQTQPSLGRDPHGSADWMDYAKLYTTCDSRTDELRLLGNGVVPSTAERAFRTLLEELYEQNT